MNGYAGKILRINLTDRKISTIDTRDYEAWGGGHGIGSALFFDLVPDKAISAFDPRNVVTIMTSPLTGTLAPSTSRTEVQGIGAQPYPIEWFTRSGVGGRFGPMLKYAGWDGIVLEGKADKPVWVDVRDAQVRIRDAAPLWGRDTYETQQRIWAEVGGGANPWDWTDPVGTGGERRSTQRPAVLTIGPAGENLSRVACLVHDAGAAAGQGGFGGVWGSKNLKAISVIGTGSVRVADPDALIQARSWILKTFMYNVDNPKKASPKDNFHFYGLVSGAPGNMSFLPVTEPSRVNGCTSCPRPCRRRTQSGAGNESICAESLLYTAEGASETLQATDLVQRAGLNAYEAMCHGYLRDLYKMGVLGPGKAIDCDLPFEKYGQLEFMKVLVDAITYRKGLGNDLAEGVVRAAKKWGRLDEDLNSGLLRYVAWGYKEHYDPRVEVEWSFGSILAERDINEHCINKSVFWVPAASGMAGEQPFLPAEELVAILAKKLVPYRDPAMLDYSERGVYGDGKVKMIAWHRSYTRFWKQSALFCDIVFPDFVNVNAPDRGGFTPEAEPRFWRAVTGKDLSFEDGLEVGRKIWNLDRSIWALQGRHRDMEVLPGYVFTQPIEMPYILPMQTDGGWAYGNAQGRTLQREAFEDWKTRYYRFEGWDPATGRPTRAGLEKLGLAKVAAELEKKDKLGGAAS